MCSALETWFLLPSGLCAPAFNMALDEALLETASRRGGPVLRWYGWTEPAATFGYFQEYANVERATHLRPLIRRPTGGGLVPHDADWTYSVVFPAGHHWYALRAEQSYRRTHEWIRWALAHLGVEIELAASPLRAAPGQCFVGHEKWDVLWCGRKIAGAAQRRTRNGLLIQGSIQPAPLRPARENWQEAMCDVATASYGAQWSKLEPEAELLERTAALATGKYARADYNRRR